jgi:hypothetical protein
MKITFDSNVWRKIASPDNFPKDPEITFYRKIRNAIDTKIINPYLCETIFTLEAIKKIDRKNIFKIYEPEINIETKELPDGVTKITFTMGPAKTNQPTLNEFLKEHLQDAISAGFNIIHFPRIGGFENQAVKPFLCKLTGDDLKEYLETLFKVAKRIEELESGFYWIEKIGRKYNSTSPFLGVGSAPDSEDPNIARAVAEWADGDSVAAHIAIGGKYFCTNDQAKASGEKSIFSAINLEILEREYNLKILSPITLVNQLLIS